MEHKKDETETAGSTTGKLSKDESCPSCDGNPLECDCIDDAAMHTYEKIKERAKKQVRGKRYRDVIAKKKYL